MFFNDICRVGFGILVWNGIVAYAKVNRPAWYRGYNYTRTIGTDYCNNATRAQQLGKFGIFSAKAFAIHKALEFTLEKQFRDFTIQSDSLSVLISSKNTYNPLDATKFIRNLIVQPNDKGNVVRFMWTRLCKATNKR